LPLSAEPTSVTTWLTEIPSAVAHAVTRVDLSVEVGTLVR
jgi:hypothetical protein